MGVADSKASRPEMPGEGSGQLLDRQQTGCCQVLIGNRSSQGVGRVQGQ